MKRCISLLLALVLLTGLCACGDFTKTTADKEGCEEFLAALLETGEQVSLSGDAYDAAHCFRVTPAQVQKNSDMEIYRFSDSFASFAFVDGRVLPLGSYLGGYGFVDGIAADVNEDGVTDLVFTSSWGLGIHRGLLSMLDGASGEVNCFYDSAEYSGLDTDLILKQNKNGAYTVYTARVRFSAERGQLSFMPQDPIGDMVPEKGGSFIPRG